jgi:hypothetical protein
MPDSTASGTKRSSLSNAVVIAAVSRKSLRRVASSSCATSLARAARGTDKDVDATESGTLASQTARTAEWSPDLGTDAILAPQHCDSELRMPKQGYHEANRVTRAQTESLSSESSRSEHAVVALCLQSAACRG